MKSPFSFFEYWSIFGLQNQFFPQLTAQKIIFLFLSSTPACFFLARKVLFFSLNYLISGHYSQIFSQFWTQNSFFLLKLSPSLFFWPEKSLFFVENWSIFGLYTQFSPNFLPKLIPSFFLARKVLFFSFKLVNFWTLF